MLVRMMQAQDIEKWQELAGEVAELFNSPNMPYEDSFIKYMKSKIEKHEVIAAIDRMSSNILGVIGFSKKNNRISWFAVKKDYRRKGIGAKLLTCAINQLDWQRDISVITFTKDEIGGLPARKLYEKFDFLKIEDNIKYDDGAIRCKMIRLRTNVKKGKSFHYNYSKHLKQSRKEHCPCCNDLPMPEGMEDVADLKYAWVTADPKAQGKLWGKCVVGAKCHNVLFYDMSMEEMANYMSEVQKVAEALHKVTGAVKINYEIHGNSGPHLHCHLFPRYLDDDFPSAPIDYRITEPKPYESDEYNYFLKRMREELNE